MNHFFMNFLVKKKAISPSDLSRPPPTMVPLPPPLLPLPAPSTPDSAPSTPDSAPSIPVPPPPCPSPHISYFRCSLSKLTSIPFKYRSRLNVGIPYFSIINSMSYVFMFGDINIFLHSQWNGGFIDMRYV